MYTLKKLVKEMKMIINTLAYIIIKSIEKNNEERKKYMKVIAVNGSPRKGGNTATLLRNALKGAETKGAATELINLYELEFKG